MRNLVTHIFDMFKSQVMTPVILCCFMMHVLPQSSLAQTTLGLGDVAITGYQSDNPDKISFVLLTCVESGTEIHFTDFGWLSTGGFRIAGSGTTKEGVLTWTSDTDLSCGAVITMLPGSNEVNSGTISSGSLWPNSISLEVAGDQVFVFQGSLASPTLLTGIQMNGAWDADAVDRMTSAQPSAFTDGVNSVSFTPERMNAVFNGCPLSGELVGSAAMISQTIYTASSWILSNSRTLTIPGDCTYNPCPGEPVVSISEACDAVQIGRCQYSLTPANAGDIISPSVVMDQVDGYTGGMQTFSVTGTDGCTQSYDVVIPACHCTVFVPVVGSFVISDPCSCNEDQTSNGSNDGTFSETVSISGQSGYDVVGNFSTPSGMPNLMFTESPAGSGNYSATFNHRDGQGYVMCLEDMMGNALTDADGVQLCISNVCEYPEITEPDFGGPLCAEDNPIDLSALITMPVEGGTITTVVNGVTTNIFDPSALGPGMHHVMWMFDGNFVDNMNGTVSDPAFPGCMSFYETTVEIHPCDCSCELQCIGQVNVSLDENCSAEINPAMGGVGITPACNNYYSIQVYDDHGEIIAGNLVDYSHVDQELTYKITEPVCGNKCWGSLNVEYKLPPRIECPDDITIPCNALQFLCYPPATAGCLDFSINLVDEVVDKLTCDTNYTAIITRTYKACDDLGNCSSCTHKITLERIDFDNIKFPESFVADDAISCTDTIIQFDENGFPLPWLFDPLTGSGSGVPILCTNPFTGSGSSGDPYPICLNGGDTRFDGMGHFPLTGSGSMMIPLIPSDITGVETPVLKACNTLVTYTDVELPVPGDCKRKIVRTWEVREWWCSDEITLGNVQLIEIRDDEAPEIICPSDYTISTDYDCAGRVDLPRAYVADQCSDEVTVAIDYGTGLIQGNGGFVDLEKGVNHITYIAMDGCHNQRSCHFYVTVVDDTEPVAVCETNKVVSLSQSSTTVVFAEPFDNGSWDECALDRFEVRRMVNDYCEPSDTIFGPSVNFCCTDVGTDDVMVVMRAYDHAGNYNDCMVRVEVQDKSVPALYCPSDTTVLCIEPYDMNNLALTFGHPDMEGACTGPNLEEVILDDLDQCGSGNIIRKYQIRNASGDVVSSCIQEIYIINDRPLYGHDIVWPLNYQTNSTCSIQDLDPENLDHPYAYPTFSGDDHCNLIGYDYTDKVFESTGTFGSCTHVERTWKVINWCGDVDNNGQFDQWTIPTPQIIEIINDINPTINETGPLSFSSQSIDCLSGPINFTMSGNDDCNDLFWKYDIVDAQGLTVYHGETNVVDTKLRVGEYIIRWTLSDGCANFDYYEQPVSVINTKLPTPVCLNGLSANLVLMDTDSDGTPDNEMVELWASDFNGGSSHSCGNPVVLSFTQDTTDKVRIYNCDHIGLNPVTIWVTDVITGLQDYCSTFIDVQDNNGDNFCPSIPKNRVDVRGEIHTEDVRMVEKVEVSLIKDVLLDTTLTDGLYAFDDMPPGGSYQVTPAKDIDYLNGVSTLDLIYIQKHILGIELLDSPYKMIAADADNSESITAIDLIELRKLILGIYDELPANTSWRFVDEAHTFVDPNNPWLYDIPEKYAITNLGSDMDIDFIGVKIGDVNNSVIAQAQEEIAIEKRSSVSLDLIIEGVEMSDNDIVTIPVYADNYQDIYGWQTTLDYDAGQLEIIDIVSGSLAMTNGINYNLLNNAEGNVVMSYSNKSPETFEANDVLFELVVKAKVDLANDWAIDLSSDQIRSEAYTENYEIIGMQSASEQVVSISDIVNVKPNPWMQRANISFNMSKGGDAQFDFYDVDGKLLHSVNGVYSSGQNMIEVTRSDIGIKGVIYIKLTTEDAITEYKMIVL